MHLIEPCCTPKHLLALRHILGESGTTLWHGYGDLSLAELLPPLLTRYSEVEMLMVTPSLPDAAAAVVRRMMEQQYPTRDGKGILNTIRHLMLVCDCSEKRSPLASTWLKKNPFPDRLTLKNVQQNDTAIILPDIALCGPINLTYGGHFTAMATKNTRTITSLRSTFSRLPK